MESPVDMWQKEALGRSLLSFGERGKLQSHLSDEVREKSATWLSEKK
jgi:hypothetical protein